MKLKLFNLFTKTSRIIVVLLAIFFIENGTNKNETKTYNENLNRTIDLASMAEKVETEKAILNSRMQDQIANNNESNQPFKQNLSIYEAMDTYVGDLTGYSPYCTGCSGVLPGLRVNARETGIYYTDKEYGTIRIVAASKNLPFGSIIRFNLPNESAQPIIAVVADRGGAITGTKLDLLVETSEYAYNNIGRKSVVYDVLRIGWER